MLLGKRSAQVVFAAATFAMALAYGIGVPDLVGLILLVLYLVLLGYLIECGLLPHTYWPFGRIDVFALAVAAACLVAALATAMGILIAGTHRDVMIALAVIMVLLRRGHVLLRERDPLRSQRVTHCGEGRPTPVSSHSRGPQHVKRKSFHFGGSE